MQKRELICVTCPIGCNLTVEYDGEKVLSVSGNTCKRGQTYAENEIVAPKRVLTTTVKTQSGKVLPVKTTQPILKGLLFAAMEEINMAVIPDGMKIGSIIIANILSSGADIVLTAE